MKVISHKVYFNVLEKVLNKISRSKFYNNRFFCALRRIRLNNTDFSIISNNCWGGICYEYYGLQKTSPTVGCYFFSNDYIKFVSNLHYYLSQPLVFISVDNSIHKDTIIKNGDDKVPIARLDDIEIVFLHYKSTEEIVQKWNRRCSRINWNNLIIKYSNMNESTQDDITKFLNLTIDGKKICFLNKELNIESKNTEIIVFPEYSKEDNVLNDTFYWKKHINITKFLNS